MNGGYHGSPCVKDCPDRGAACTQRCRRGYAAYREARDALYAMRSKAAEDALILDTGRKKAQNKYYRDRHNHGRR